MQAAGEERRNTMFTHGTRGFIASPFLTEVSTLPGAKGSTL